MNQRISSTIAIAFIVSAGLACSLLSPRKQLTWHILLEIDAVTPDKIGTVERTISIIERRLDAIDLHNASVVAQGAPANGRILVSLPDVRDRERVLKLITSRGLLELTAVVSPPSPMPAQTYSTEEEAQASIEGSATGTRRVLPYKERADPSTDASSQQTGRWVVVEVPAIVDGSELRDASAISLGDAGNYQISFSLRPEGSQKFGAWTGAHINEYIGVVLNGEVKSIAYIKSQIFDSGEISGRFTKQSAEDLALILRAGALPVPVKVISESNDK